MAGALVKAFGLVIVVAIVLVGGVEGLREVTIVVAIVLGGEVEGLREMLLRVP